MADTLDLFVSPVDQTVYGAKFSDCGRYRYRLWRAWGAGQVMAWIMLNPSTADAERDDQTIRRCMRFARREGFDGIEVVNLYAYRATHPKELSEVYQVEGIDNARHWHDLLTDARIGMVVAAWGSYRPKVEGEILRSRALETLYDTPVWCLGTTKSGAPRHPLYVKGDQPFVRWGPAACERCGHSAEWHRLDDSLNIDPTSPSAEFRCLGADFKGCVQHCPDFVAPAGFDAWIEGR